MSGVDGEIGSGVSFDNYLIATMRDDKTISTDLVGNSGGDDSVKFGFFESDSNKC